MSTMKWVSSDRSCGTFASREEQEESFKMEGQGLSNSDMAGLRQRGSLEQNICDENWM